MRRHAALLVLFLLLASTATPCSAIAQGFPGGGLGGMGGGRGRGGGGRGGRPGGEASGQRGPSGGDVAKQFEELASLDRALRDVPDLDRQKKDSAKAIEDTYARILKFYAIVARNKVDSARATSSARASMATSPPSAPRRPNVRTRDDRAEGRE
jgi:hypothetical protein